MSEKPDDAGQGETSVGSRTGTSTGEENANAVSRARTEEEQLEEEQRQRKIELDRAVAEAKRDAEETERELAETTDPAERARLQDEFFRDEADLRIALAEQNAFDDYGYEGSFEDFIDASPRQSGSFREMSGADQAQQARSLYPSYMARASGWDLLEFGPLDMVPLNRLRRLVRLKRLSPLQRLQRARQARQTARARAQDRVRRRGQRKRRRDDRCRQRRGNPAHVVTGVRLHADPAFVVPGALPLTVGSFYHSDLVLAGAFGSGRVSELDAAITEREDGWLELLDEDGLPVRFRRPKPVHGHWEEGDTTRAVKLAAAEGRVLLLAEEGVLTRFRRFADGIYHPVEMSDRAGNRRIYTHGADGRLTGVATPEGLQISFAYDAAGCRVSARLTGTGGETRDIMRWEYDGAGHMICAEAVFGPVLRYGYDAAGRLASTADSRGHAATHTYDERGRVVLVSTNGPFDGDRFRYDDAVPATTYLPSGDRKRAETFEIDAEGTVAARIDALGHRTLYEYDANGYIAAEVDGEGNRSVFRHDAQGRVGSLADPEGRETFLRYDEDGRIEIEIDNLGNARNYEYGEDGALVAVIDALGYRTDISNDERGRPVGIMRHDGLIEARRYDVHGNVTDISDYRGGRTEIAYDAFNRVVSITDPLGETTRWAYDDRPGCEFWQPSRITGPDAGIHRLEINAREGVTRTSDAEGRTTVYRHGYGTNDLLREIEDPAHGLVRLFYDGTEQLVRIENARGASWTLERDRAGRIVRETDFDGLSIAYEHDRADRIVAARYPDGSHHRYSYDASGLMVREEVFEPGAAEPAVTTFRYDGRAMLAEARNDAAVVMFERDAAGRIIAETVNGRRVQSSYDCCGNRVERRIDDRLTTYDYDPMGALASLTLEGHAPLAFSRDKGGRETERRSASGFVLSQRWVEGKRLDRQRAGQGVDPRLGTASDSLSPAAPFTPRLATERHYSWNRVDEPTGWRDRLWGEAALEHDVNGQVRRARFGDGTAEQFDYDVALDVSASGVSGTDGIATPRFRNWLTSASGRAEEVMGPLGERVSLEWDARRRIVARRVERDGFRPRTWRYAWDAKDRLVGCVEPSGARWRYGYDAFGRRLWKRRDPGSSPAHDGETAFGSAYLWDGDVVAQETALGADGQPLAGGETVHWHFEPDGFAPLARETVSGGSQGPGTLLYVASDHMGTPRELFTTAGEPVWAAEFHLWGGIRRLWTVANDNGAPAPSREWVVLASAGGGSAGEEGPGGAAGRLFTHGALALAGDPDLARAKALCPIRFQGQWEDDETGFSYNRFRHYLAEAAQYTSPDPIGLEGGLRTHGYVENPLFWIDPFGLQRYPSWMPMRPGFQRQHIIPHHLQNHPFLRNLGFDVNSRQNMMYMPTRACSVGGGGSLGQRGGAQHRGFEGHRAYNVLLGREVDDLARRTNNQSRRCQQLAVRALQLRYRTLLSTGAIQIAPCKS